jgi:hypothetical protein
MDTSKLPPLIAMSLGLLGCVAEPCLSFDPSEGTSTGGTGTAGESGSGSESTAFNPCLGAVDTTGPCLSPPMDSSGTGSDTGGSSESGTGSDTGGSDTGGSDTGTTGAMLDEPPASRAAAVERVLERGTLPADVLARLRALSQRPEG